MTLPFLGGFEELDKAAMSGIDVQPTMQGQRQMRSETGFGGVSSSVNEDPGARVPDIWGWVTYCHGEITIRRYPKMAVNGWLLSIKQPF